ncbi:NTP transferase domain-containing protein [Lacibacterium aquatile]|uniref:NTP transferase domain-containing protein n=1 Tax=Lacibacterium aquatile TaxID=1168082 RepID=A0ABW5DXU1_9PROT
MKAIILSAGQGKRLLPHTATRPKCLMPLSGRSVLEWQLESLASAGVTEVVVVTGFGADQVDAVLATRDFPGLSVRTLYNPFYSVADNLGSCWIARKEMVGAFAILNGDTLFDGDVAQHVLLHPTSFPITVTVNRKPTYDSDDMKVATEGDKLVAIGKTLDADVTDGESIGFLRFTEEGGRIFVAEVEKAMATTEGLRRWYLSAIDQIAKAQNCVGIRSIQGLDWCELDFPADYDAMQNMVRGWLQRDELGSASASKAAG